MGFGYAVYFTERVKNRVVRWDPDSGDVDVVAGEPKDGDPSQTLRSPYGLASDQGGSLLIADKMRHRVCRLNGGRLTPITFLDPKGGRARIPGGRMNYHETRPECPTALFMEPGGSFLCTFSDEHTIYRVHTDGSLEHVLGIQPNRYVMLKEYRPAVSPGEVLRTPLWMPTGIVKRKDGTIFFIERLWQTVRAFHPAKGLSCVFPLERREEYAFRLDVPDRIAVTDYHPGHPGALALDADDNLYLCESQQGCVFRVDFQSGELRKVLQITDPKRRKQGGPAAAEFGPDGTAWVLNTSERAVEAYAPAVGGPWKPKGTRLTQIRGQDLAVPSTGSGLAFGR